jgi:hypothetical protein
MSTFFLEKNRTDGVVSSSSYHVGTSIAGGILVRKSLKEM